MEKNVSFEISVRKKIGKSTEVGHEFDTWEDVLSAIPKICAEGFPGIMSTVSVSAFRDGKFPMGEEVMRFDTDENGAPDPRSVPALAENQALQQPGLRMDREMEYEDWREETGLDDSAVGSDTRPGTADIYDAALRIYHRETLVGIPSIGVSLWNLGREYRGVSVTFPEADEAIFFSDDPSSDMERAMEHAHASWGGAPMIDGSLYEARNAGVLDFSIGDEEGLRVHSTPTQGCDM